MAAKRTPRKKKPVKAPAKAAGLKGAPPGEETPNNPAAKAKRPQVTGAPTLGRDGKNPESVNNPAPKAIWVP